MIPREEGEGVGPKDAGDGALKAPLGELAACKLPNQRHHITQIRTEQWEMCNFFLSIATVISFFWETANMIHMHSKGFTLYMHKRNIVRLIHYSKETFQDTWLEEWHFPLPSHSPNLSIFSCCV